jgi:hypothetical protein
MVAERDDFVHLSFDLISDIVQLYRAAISTVQKPH